MKKAIILIDGQNLFYSLQNLQLKERDINWSNLFGSLLENGDELVRTYWFRPQKIQDAHLTPEAIKNQVIYKNYNGCYEAYRNGEHHKINPITQTKIDEECREVQGWLSEQKKRFANIEYNYDQLCLENNDIEIIKTGIVKVNPYKFEFIGEKGVDIALAVKMISLSVEKRCDKIILLSGDYDYAEAIKYVKNNMTKIHIVKIHKGFPPKNKNMSRDLSVLADKVLDVYEADIRQKFLKEVV